MKIKDLQSFDLIELEIPQDKRSIKIRALSKNNTSYVCYFHNSRSKVIEYVIDNLSLNIIFDIGDDLLSATLGEIEYVYEENNEFTFEGDFGMLTVICDSYKLYKEARNENL